MLQAPTINVLAMPESCSRFKRTYARGPAALPISPPMQRLANKTTRAFMGQMAYKKTKWNLLTSSWANTGPVRKMEAVCHLTFISKKKLLISIEPSIMAQKFLNLNPHVWKYL